MPTAQAGKPRIGLEVQATKWPTVPALVMAIKVI